MEYLASLINVMCKCLYNEQKCPEFHRGQGNMSQIAVNVLMLFESLCVVLYFNVLIMIYVVIEVTCIFGPTIRRTRWSSRVKRRRGGGCTYSRVKLEQYTYKHVRSDRESSCL